MSDITKYRRIYHTLITPVSFVLLWFLVFDRSVSSISAHFVQFSIASGSIFLITSLALKRFKNIITVTVIAIVGISLLVIIYENNVVFGYVFYSLTYSILSADAVYSQTGKKNKLLILIISFVAFAFIISALNSLVDTNKSVDTQRIEQKETTVESTLVKQNSPVPVKDSADIKSIAPEKIEKVKVTFSETEKNKIRREISAFLSEWESAWESRNLKRYSSYYSYDLICTDKDGNELSYDERMKTAGKNFKNLKYLNIEVQNIVYEFDDNYPNEVTVKFRQTYSSNTYYDYGLKTLMIFKGKSTAYKWKIYREKFETIKETRNTAKKQDGQVKTEEGTSIFTKICWGLIIILIIAIILAIIRWLSD